MLFSLPPPQGHCTMFCNSAEYLCVVILEGTKSYLNRDSEWGDIPWENLIDNVHLSRHFVIISNNQKDFLQTESRIASAEAFCPPFSSEIKGERPLFLIACVISFLPNQRLHSVSNPAWLGVEVLALTAVRGAGPKCLMASMLLQSTSMLCKSVCICICKPENGYSGYKIGSFTACG